MSQHNNPVAHRAHCQKHRHKLQWRSCNKTALIATINVGL